MSVGSNLIALRRRYHLSQNELAQIAGVTNKAISSWELNKKMPRMDSLQRIADHFGMKKSDLIEEDGVRNFFSDKISTPKDTPVSISDDETSLIYTYRLLNSNGRSAIWGVMKALTSREPIPEQQQLSFGG